MLSIEEADNINAFTSYWFLNNNNKKLEYRKIYKKHHFHGVLGFSFYVKLGINDK